MTNVIEFELPKGVLNCEVVRGDSRCQRSVVSLRINWCEVQVSDMEETEDCWVLCVVCK
jgi:hypothetical protein